MLPPAAPSPQADADRLKVAPDQASRLAAVTRDAVKALILANGFLEAQVAELQADVSKGYARG